MILTSTFTKDWIGNLRKQPAYKKADTANLEKMLFAFQLLEKLAENKLNFIFKGGTAMILLFDRPYRFSIDIDIITTEKRASLEKILDIVVENSFFTRWQLDEKRSYNAKIPKAHYQLYYKKANYSLGRFILLDVLFAENPYPKVQKLPVKTNLLDTKAPYFQVNVPTINSILGDKLTAFAPNTTGIKYKMGKEIEIIKQLFDVSHLIDNCNDLDIVKQSFEKSALEEINYRGMDITSEQIVEDIFHTAIILARRDKNKTEPEKSQFIELQTGIKNIANYLINKNLRIEQAIAATAKTAWFVQLLMHNKPKLFILYSENLQINHYTIENTAYNFINRFKRTNKEAFYYWYKCLEIMELLS